MYDDEDLLWLVGKAKGVDAPRDPSASRDLLHIVLSCIENGERLPAPVAAFLYEGFAAYLSGEQPVLERALLLVAPTQRAEEVNKRVVITRTFVSAAARRRKAWGLSQQRRERDARTQIWVVAMLHFYIKRGGVSKSAALLKLEEKYLLSPRTIERYDQELNLIRNYDVAGLKSLIRTENRAAKK